MIVSLIAAVAQNGVIGSGGTLPWDIPEDRRLFRRITLGHPVIMGRRTFLSLGHPLPGRRNIVLSRDPVFHPEGCLVASSLDAALRACADAAEIFVCGGAEVFRLALPLADRIYLTLIHRSFPGDTIFPPIPPGAFREVGRQALDAGIPCSFVILERIAPTGSAHPAGTDHTH